MAGIPASPLVRSAGGGRCGKQVWNEVLPALLKKQCGGIKQSTEINLGCVKNKYFTRQQIKSCASFP